MSAIAISLQYHGLGSRPAAKFVLKKVRDVVFVIIQNGPLGFPEMRMKNYGFAHVLPIPHDQKKCSSQKLRLSNSNGVLHECQFCHQK